MFDNWFWFGMTVSALGELLLHWAPWPRTLPRVVERARRWITEQVRDTPESLALWGRVVTAYCAQWSSKSYTVMVNDYYLQGRVPGQPARRNCNRPPQRAVTEGYNVPPEFADILAH